MSGKGTRRSDWLLAAPALVLVGLFLFVPYLNIVVMSVRTPSTTRIYDPGFSLENYRRALGDGLYLGILLDTILLGVTVSAIALILGYPVAYFLARTRSRWRALLYALLLSPLLVGVVIRSFGWIVLLANNGAINQALKAFGLGPWPLMYNTLGVTIGLVHVFLPFMILPVMNAIQGIDERLLEAAQTLGASRARSFLRVVVPMSLPGIQAGTILVFVLTTSAYVVPALLGSGQAMTTPSLVVQQLLGAFLWPFGAALALVLSACALVIVWLFGIMTRRGLRGLA